MCLLDIHISFNMPYLIANSFLYDFNMTSHVQIIDFCNLFLSSGQFLYPTQVVKYVFSRSPTRVTGSGDWSYWQFGPWTNWRISFPFSLIFFITLDAKLPWSKSTKYQNKQVMLLTYIYELQITSKFDLRILLYAYIHIDTHNKIKEGLILGLCQANERRRYFVTTSLICWA